jgi:predicted O-methyltransferase YrrM
MLDRGLPPRLAPPLRFLFDGRETRSVRESADAIESARAEIARRHGSFTLPSTSTSHPPTLTWPWLANHVSVQRRWGVFLQLCADAMQARAVLELGACVGISGAYLGSAMSRPRVVSIEASPELAPVAAGTIARFAQSSDLLTGMFAGRLPDALRERYTLAYVDGHHDGDATIAYVQAIAPHLEPHALIILDDIRLYREMDAAWHTLRRFPGVGAAVDVGRFGLLLWGEGDGSLYDLSRYTGWWRVGGARPPMRPAA